MKKALLLTAGLLAASIPMSAEFKASQFENTPFMGISPNGKYGVFTIDGILLGVVNLEDYEEGYIYTDEREDVYMPNEYIHGYGTCVADNGIAVGNAVLYEYPDDETYTTRDVAVIYDHGELKELPAPSDKLSNTAHAITPDGSMICGNIGNDEFSITASNIMVVPAVWQRNSQGEYDQPILLPHPDKDFLGAVPQYVTAIAISADGNTVAGHVVSNTGFFVYPIVYHRNAAGEWSYELPNLNLFYTHPEVEIPEDPGDYPEKEDFMTPEEKAAYDAAMQAWQDAGGDDWDNYPNMDDFMTPEELAAYQAACDAHDAASAAYNEAIDKATEGSISLVFNTVVLSPDGKYYAGVYAPDSGFGPMKPGKVSSKYSRVNSLKKSTREGEGDGDDVDYTAATYIFNLEDDSYKAYRHTDGVNVTCAANNGIFTAWGGSVYYPTALIIDPAKGVSTIQEYYQESCPELSTWVNENMSHEVEVYDPDTGDTYTDTQILSGIPYCTPDMKTMTSYVQNTFDVMNPAFYFGYLFQGLPEQSSGVKEVLAKNPQLSVLRGGIINVNGDAYVEVFAADGSKVFGGNASGALSTGLRSGIYVVRARFADGKVATCKAMF